MSGEAIIGLVVTIVVGVAGFIISIFYSSKKKTNKVINKNVMNFKNSNHNDVRDNNFGMKK